MNQEKIREDLLSLADKKYKEFHSGLCPNTDNIMGVRVPILRNYAKELVKQDWKDYLKTAKNDYYEEIMLQGMVIGLAKIDIKESLQYIEQFVPKIYNWAVCDVFCAGLKITNKHLDEVWKFIQKYFNSKKEFELRFGIVMLLDYYIKEEYIKEVLEIFNKIQHEGYYVKMAVAWAISVAYIKFPVETMELLKNNNLDNFTYNKAIQKCIESYRIEDKQKELLREMKR